VPTPNILASKSGEGPLSYCIIGAKSEGFNQQRSLVSLPNKFLSLYHLTLLTGSRYLFALVIRFRRRLSISRHMPAVHTVDKNSRVLHYNGNRMVSDIGNVQ
jgi:hypothetical protein